jgi:protein-glutamine gamma-glutamyltransferase
LKLSVERIHSNKKIIAQLLLLALPTMLVGGYLCWHANQRLNILGNLWLTQAIWFGGGVATSLILYAWRFRFASTFVLVLLFNSFLYWLTGRLVTGEFDPYFARLSIRIFGWVFSIGWLVGYGFSRSRFFSIGWCVGLLLLQLLLVAQMRAFTATDLMLAFAPVLFYAAYIIYASELLRNMNEEEQNFAGFVAKRVSIFSAVCLALIAALVLLNKKEFTTLEKQWGNNGEQNEGNGDESSLNKDNKDGTVSPNKKGEMKSKQKRGNRLVFVAHLNHFFEDGQTPNPLYFTANYFTRFDSATQNVEVDTLMPSNDLMQANPATIPLYFAKKDSNVVRNAKASLMRKVVDAEVYKAALGAEDFLAPSTAFFCQPIAVGKEFKSQFKSAYRVKSNISELNSAYFTYNPAGNTSLETFQEKRFEELRKVDSMNTVEQDFYQYYTYMPRGAEYDSVRKLAHRITDSVVKPIDKIVAIRNYFLSKDEFGQPLYRYTDNPGVPGIPGANKIFYFLFESHSGYCTYYATSTLFLLRSLGIPARVAAGFLTVDRASKNPGWYWFYEDQAHAWVQAYFPGYGWIDFDTTVPDEATQQSPAPDGTPPLNPEAAQFVATGKTLSIDLAQKRVNMQVEKLMLHDQEFELKQPLLIDVSLATITKDSGVVDLSVMKPNDAITAMSYAEVFKQMEPALDGNEVLAQSPKPAPIDEVQILNEEKAKAAENKKTGAVEKPFSWKRFLWRLGLALLLLTGLMLLLPTFIWWVLRGRTKKSTGGKATAYAVHNATAYYLHQLRRWPKQETATHFAAAMDAEFNTSTYAAFMKAYQKLKYSDQLLTTAEQAAVNEHFDGFIKKVKTTIPAKQRMLQFLNPLQALRYFAQPNKNS